MIQRLLTLAGVAGALLCAPPGLTTPLAAQQWEERIPGNAGEWGVQALRPSGQPVIPVFDGWYAEEDGTASLCFGYFNLNFDEALEIPVGPYNYIEPEEYNGVQPTYFSPVPLLARNKQRHYCVFTINVPQGGGQDIVCTSVATTRITRSPPTPERWSTGSTTSTSPTDRAERADRWRRSSGSWSPRGRRESARAFAVA